MLSAARALRRRALEGVSAAERAVAEAERPEPGDQDRVAIAVHQLALRAPVSESSHRREVADEQIAAEGAEVRRCDHQTPRRVDISTGDQPPRKRADATAHARRAGRSATIVAGWLCVLRASARAQRLSWWREGIVVSGVFLL